MLSRVADSIYWMSRYTERADNIARVVDVTLRLILDLPAGDDQQWLPLVETTGDSAEFAKRYGKPTPENVLRFLTFDPENPNSIVACLRAARENARSIREIISSAMWEQLNQFYLMTTSAQQEVLADAYGFFEQVKLASHLFNGVTDATLTHGEAWHFCHLGRMLERADKTSRILDVKYYLLLPSVGDVGTPIDDVQWAALLRSASAFEMYRKKHGRIVPDRVVDFLLLDAEFPRAIQKCLNEARHSLHAISGTPQGLFRNAAERGLGELCSELAFANVADLISVGLHEYVDKLQIKMNAVSQGICEAFFAPKLAPPSPKERKRSGASQS